MPGFTLGAEVRARIGSRVRIYYAWKVRAGSTLDQARKEAREEREGREIWAAVRSLHSPTTQVDLLELPHASALTTTMTESGQMGEKLLSPS